MQIGGNHAAALSQVWLRIQELYDNLGASYRLGKLTLDMICNTSAPYQNFPVLTTAIKAAETRQLLPVVYQLTKDFDAGDAHSADRRCMLQQLLTFYSTIKECSAVPTAQQGHVIESSITNFLLFYQKCSSWAVDGGHMLYKTTQKFHHCFHMGQQGRFLSPRATWEYSFESFVGKMVTLGNACTYGSNTFHLSTRLAEKYICAFYLQLRRQWED